MGLLMKSTRLFGRRSVTLVFLLMPTLAISGNNLQDEEIALKGHKGAIAAVGISPSGKLAFSIEAGSNDVHMWSIPDGKKIRILSCPLKSVTFLQLAIAHDGRELTLALDGHLLQWDLTNPGQSKQIKMPTKEDETISAIAYSYDGSMLAVAIETELHILDRKTGKTKHKYSNTSEKARFVEFSRDSKHVIGSFGHDGGWDLLIWKLSNKEKATILRSGHRHISSIVASPDSNIFFAGGWDEQVSCWDIAKKQKIATMDGIQAVSCMSHDPKRAVLAIATFGGGVDFWDTVKVKPIKTIKPGTSVGSIAFAPDGDSMLVGFSNPFNGPDAEDNRGELVLIRFNRKKN